tara:strand:+ start:1312 stop:1812 length:501 start_codon:yes stop_codon:yes gene_type:complete
MYGNKYEDIVDLEDIQQDKNEKYITAQILSGDLVNVYKLFEKNLKTKTSKDKDVEEREFREELVSIFSNIGIELKEFQPSNKNQKKKKGKKSKGNYLHNQYYLEFSCDYIEFGQLITAMEASRRLINILEFSYDNSRDNIPGKLGNDDDLPPARVTMEIASITLKK